MMPCCLFTYLMRPLQRSVPYEALSENLIGACCFNVLVFLMCLA